MKKFMTIVAAIACLTILSNRIQAKETIQIEGSTTVGPIAEAFASAFVELYSDVKITIKKTGSGDGAAALIDGRCDIAAMSRFMKNEEFKRAVKSGVMPVPFAVAMDGVCVIINPANPVDNLTMDQVQSIYDGKVTNWSQLGGPSRSIVAISRDTSSGTYEVFSKLCMRGDKMSDQVEYTNSNPQVFTRVSTTPDAIGYVGLGFVKTGVKAVKLDSVVPTKKSIVSGRYPLARPLFLFTNGFPTLGSPTFTFCNFFLSEEGQEIIEAKGFVPVTDY